MNPKNKKLITFSFFITIFLIGLFVFRDYGIQTDERNNYNFGQASLEQYKMVLSGNPPCSKDYCEYEHNLIHGPLFEVFLAIIKNLFFSSSDVQNIFFMRHLMNFLMFFLSLIYFYKICVRSFNDTFLGLLGSTFLFLSPRIFADSFYNSVDIGALAAMIFSTYSMLLFLEDNRPRNALIHGAVCAVGIAMRSVVVFNIFITVVFVLIDRLKENTGKTALAKSLFPYGLSLALFSFILIPLTWAGPIKLLDSLHTTLSLTTPAKNLFFGSNILANTVPWYFNIVWIAISTPLLYIILFLWGLVSICIAVYKKNRLDSDLKINAIYFLSWFFVPIILCVLLNTSLYGGWRHLYFIYPALIIISIYGFRSIQESIESKIGKIMFYVAVALALAQIAFQMVQIHPYEGVYFNAFVSDKAENCILFERDYFGSSYRGGLEYILENDKSDTIPVFIQVPTGAENIAMISQEQRRRIIFTPSGENAKYFISNIFSASKSEECAVRANNETGNTHFIKAGDLPILSITQLHN